MLESGAFMLQAKYEMWDVFTGKPLAGNQLGVVPDAAGLSDKMMQQIARELNLSETIFFMPPQNPEHTAKVRIFMPLGELSFAGHPTVGGAVARAARDGIASGEIILEEGVGPVRCSVEGSANKGRASFAVPRRPVRMAFADSAEAVARASGLDTGDIASGSHEVSIWSAGVPFLMVPVKSLDALAKVTVDASRFTRLDVHRDGKIAAGYFYVATGANAFQVRMFAPWDGIAEDPATGAAAAAFAGAVAAFEKRADGVRAIEIVQGVEMGRRSEIGLSISMQAGEIAEARISGEAVKIASGTLYLPD
jgi:trans-2,3-dihydro-3-hydroxyanthranilate isomerase